MKNYSYWLDTINYDFLKSSEIPNNLDVLIVGFGYTGLNAAIQISKEGRSVCVIDKNDLGDGCSSKNGGQISNLLKPSLKILTKKYGFEKDDFVDGVDVGGAATFLEFAAESDIQLFI